MFVVTGLVASVCNKLFSKKKKAMALVEESSVSSAPSLPFDSACKAPDSYPAEHPTTLNCDTQAINISNTGDYNFSPTSNASDTDCSESITDSPLAVLAEVCASVDVTPDISPGVPDPPADVSLMLQEILSLDLNMEFVTRYQAKPKSMYTFLCSQVFRRDEYAAHFRNLHTEILCNLNGWLEHRCPLAAEGCTYSYRFVCLVRCFTVSV